MKRRQFIKSFAGGMIMFNGAFDVSASQDKHTLKSKAIFAFDPTIDASLFAQHCHDWGINTAILHPGFFTNPTMKKALDAHDIALCLNVPVFFNQAFLEKHPDYYAITNKGRRAIHDWSHFVCPSKPGYIHQFVNETLPLIEKNSPEVISLDFIRHFVFWELVDIEGDPKDIEDGCYCPDCMRDFSHSIGEKLPDTPQLASELIRNQYKKAWGQWKTSQISAIAKLLIDTFRKASPQSHIWVKTVPWRQNDLEGAIQNVTGQDIAKLGELADVLVPMAFTHMLKQTPEWKTSLLDEVTRSAKKPVLSYAQVKNIFNPQKISLQQLEAELQSGLRADNDGIVIFHYEQLLEENEKASLLKKYLKPS